MVNNVPVDVLAERGYKNLIVIRIYGIGVDTERRAELPEDVNVYRIAPRRNLGGILEFEKKRTRRSMTLGYFDARRCFMVWLAESIILSAHTEAYYFNRLMTEIQIFRHYFSVHLEHGDGEGTYGYRMYTERVFPALAEKFRLKPTGITGSFTGQSWRSVPDPWIWRCLISIRRTGSWSGYTGY